MSDFKFIGIEQIVNESDSNSKATMIMRSKAQYFFSGNNEVTSSENNYGLPSKNYAPPEMKPFEDDLVKSTSNIRFRYVADPFLSKVQEDIKNINSSQKVVVFADKSTNVYETSPENYSKTLTDNITKSYKLSGNACVTDTINQGLKDITNSLSIGNRIDIMAERNAYITLKDHR